MSEDKTYINSVINEPDDVINTDKEKTKAQKDDLNLKISLFLHFNKIPYALPSRLTYNYIMLDTDNLIEFAPSFDTYAWYINDKIPRYEQGYINLHGYMKNIVMMRIARSIFANQYMPETLSLRTNRIGFSFNEFNSQAIISPNGARYQFIQQWEEDFGNTITMTPFNLNRGWFRFREKIRTLDKLTLNIFDIFTKTRITMPDTVYSLPAVQRFGLTVSSVEFGSITNPLEITDFHMLPLFYSSFSDEGSTDDPAVTHQEFGFSGFTTDSPGLDAALIASYNSTVSILIKHHSIYFQPPVDISSAHFSSTPDSAPVYVVWIYKPRMTVQVELVSELDEQE